jgi:predicted porin
MKNSLFALGALCMATGSVSAQSSLTLYGIVDLSVRQVRNQGAESMVTLGSGNNLTSRFGLRGTEDLGGGLKAGFNVEGGISADTGNSSIPGQLFDRESYVSLANSQWGELRAGRDLTPVYTTWSVADPFNQTGLGSVVALYPLASSTAPNPLRAAFGTNDRNATTTTRTNNMLLYILPSGQLGGVNGTAFITAGENSPAPLTSTSGNKQKGFSIGYSKGPLSLRVAYAVTTNSVTGGDNEFKDRAVHAIYDFGVARAAIAQRQYKYLAATQDIFQLTLSVPIGAHTVKVSHGRLNNKGSVGTTDINGLDVQSLALGYQYDFSKRTALYANLARLKNDGASAVTFSGGSTAGFQPGNHSTGFELGLRHNF